MTPDQLKAWRKRHGLTQSQAADLLCRSLRGYQDWEYSTTDIPPLVDKVCAAIDAPERFCDLFPLPLN